MAPRFALLDDETFPDGRTFRVVASISGEGPGVPLPDGVGIGDVFVGGGFQSRAAILTPPATAQDPAP